MKVYKFFRFTFTEAMWELSSEERKAYQARLDAALEQVGGKQILMATPYWSEEQWIGCGVEEFPSLEAAMQHAALLYDMSHPRYVQGESWLATEYSFDV